MSSAGETAPVQEDGTTPAGLLMERLRALGVELSIGDGKLHYSGPRGSMTPDLVEELKARKREVLDILTAEAAYAELCDRASKIRESARECEQRGELGERDRLLSELQRLVDGPQHQAHQRILALVYPDCVDQVVTVKVQILSCELCGSLAHWQRADGQVICSVCHPDPESTAAMATGIPADGHGTLKLRVLEVA